MVSLFSMEGLSGLLFFAFIGITLAGALIATNARSLIRSVAGLALCFLGVAGLYYYLNSPFVALMQILIYVGAVCVTIIFAVMLAGSSELKQLTQRNGLVGPLAILASGILVFALAGLALKTEWLAAPCLVNRGTVEDLGQSLLTTYSMSFELISVVLLVAVVGSLVLARQGRDK
ncbi:MAG: NADH-quinone oxidoreductase subunit J [Proteobacteria bacterium]|jgi:NADH-quinone oxidoreductase subunit J|nr:NADH-quinone oxidoreductase subunit J [Pseudomonadota bacterium]MBU4412365.1 NADH-quinone oxidoreductase subunit J [Pseudomonadota bacterium]MCG2822832.1 NADH-quinone oxidoreductase subunit J [Desulfobulbaceae bacterium]MDP2002018.1 NADH-quinone oxidoreductase subunit J [Desulfurivibrionaceae bacterium]